MRRRWSCAMAIIALMTMPVLASAAAPAETSLPSYCEVAVDGSFADQRKFVQAWASDGVRAGLEQAKIDAGDVSNGRVLIVEIGGKPFAYAGTIDVRGDDDEARTFECKCSPDDLVAKIAEEVVVVAPGLVATRAVTDGPADVPASVSTTATPAAVVDEGPQGKKKKLGKGGRAGAVLIGVGSAAVIGGVVLLALGERSDRDGADTGREQMTDYRPAGGATLGVGAALVITGAVLVAVDRKRARRVARTTMMPVAGARSWGLAITGRF